MRIYESEGIGRVFILHLRKGDGVLEGIREVIAKYQLQNAVVVSGVGSLRQLHYHFISSLANVAEDQFDMAKNPIEMGAIQGLIIESVPHLHVTASDPNRAYIGHLEPESEVQYLAEICIMELKGADLTRRKDEFGVTYIDKK